MNLFPALKSCSGSWTGTNRLHYPPDEPPQDSLSELTVTRERETVRLEYTWSYQGDPQQGTLTLHEEPTGEVSAQLVDSWHTGGSPMQFAQTNNQDCLSLLGSYPAESGPDWGWRIDLEPSQPFRIRMFNIEPEQEAQIAVEATFDRRSDS